MLTYVYVAGPYANGDTLSPEEIERNVKTAIHVANSIATSGHGYVPFLPHLYHYWHAEIPHSTTFWLGLDLRWLDLCDVLFLLPGVSEGASLEVAYAKLRGIPIVHSLAELNTLRHSQLPRRIQK